MILRTVCVCISVKSLNFEKKASPGLLTTKALNIGVVRHLFFYLITYQNKFTPKNVQTNIHRILSQSCAYHIQLIGSWIILYFRQTKIRGTSCTENIIFDFIMYWTIIIHTLVFISKYFGMLYTIANVVARVSKYFFQL